MKATKYLSKLAEKRTRNVLAIIVMFACTSICFGTLSPLAPGNTITLNSLNVANRWNLRVAGNSVNPNGTGLFSLDPNKNTLIIKEGAIVGEASGAYIDNDSGSIGSTMTDNKIVVHGGKFNYNHINGACSLVETRDVNVNDNIVEINAGNNIGWVYGGYTLRGTVFGNKVFINKVTIGGDVYGGYVYKDGNANNNRVTITGATVSGARLVTTAGHVFGGLVEGNNGNANNSEVTIDGGMFLAGLFWAMAMAMVIQ